MRSHQERHRSRFCLESLEGRIALSSVGGVVGNRGGHAAEVSTLRRGADDPAGHDANDDRGGRRGRDDAVNHDANDDHGGMQAARRGADDPAGHDANDDHGGRRGRRG